MVHFQCHSRLGKNPYVHLCPLPRCQPRGWDRWLHLHPFLDPPKVRKNKGPKPLKRAQTAIALCTFGVQVKTAAPCVLRQPHVVLLTSPWRNPKPLEPTRAQRSRLDIRIFHLGINLIRAWNLFELLPLSSFQEACLPDPEIHDSHLVGSELKSIWKCPKEEKQSDEADLQIEPDRALIKALDIWWITNSGF